jgi:hypothetical protein
MHSSRLVSNWQRSILWDLNFFFVDLELRKIVAYFSFFKAFCPAFPYLVDSSPPVVTDSRVPGLPGSQNFQSIFRALPNAH